MGYKITWNVERSITINDEDFQWIIDNYVPDACDDFEDPMGKDIDEMALQAVDMWAMELDDIDYYSMPHYCKHEIADELRRRLNGRIISLD